MGDPVPVRVVASDPILESGVTSALLSSPDLCVILPQEVAKVAVVIVDGVLNQVCDLLRLRRELAGRPEIVLVAADFGLPDALRAIAAGARGLVRRREADAGRLARAVLAAACGDCTVPPDMLAEMIDRGAACHQEASPPGIPPGSGLTKREHAVLSLIADGLETHEIARELCYSPRTVIGVVHDITHRFGLRNRAHAVAYALRVGLL
ncbi:MAG TPA: LuxR C-terminal-related transcriptional regulator [Streptosporangiaceae bacterium]|nr:LuxR C-terminal-related transcriptional regulator [Streptosporangiaceae bacterium]